MTKNYLFKNNSYLLVNLKEDLNLMRNLKEIDISYSWALKVLKEMQSEGLLIIESKGRENFAKLTEKGREIKANLEKIDALVVVKDENKI